MINRTKPKKLVILDLDETLIYATHFPPHALWDFELLNYKVFKRPGLHQFLEGLCTHFEIAVWSSASDYYVDQIVDLIFPDGYPLKFVWGRSNCTLQSSMQAFGDGNQLDHMNYVKILSKVEQKGFAEIPNMIIVDDSPSKAIHNIENAIIPEAYLGSRQDRELHDLLKFLLDIKDHEDFRLADLINWRNKDGGL